MLTLLVLSLVAGSLAADSFTFPSFFSANTAITATGVGKAGTPSWAKRVALAAGAPERLRDFAVSGVLSFDSSQAQGFRFDLNGSYPIPDVPAWASSLIMLDSGSTAFLNASSGRCVFSCDAGECCGTSSTASGLPSRPHSIATGLAATPAPAVCACSLIDPFTLAAKAFSQATKDTAGCAVAGTTGTLFQYDVPSIDLAIKYCLDSASATQLLSLAFAGTGSVSDLALTLSFSDWSSALPPASTFAIPSSCSC
jgi:hypothetical protein